MILYEEANKHILYVKSNSGHTKNVSDYVAQRTTEESGVITLKNDHCVTIFQLQNKSVIE